MWLAQVFTKVSTNLGLANIYKGLGGSPGLVVMGGDLYSERSWVRIPAPYTGWTFFTWVCCINCNVCLKRPKINAKEAGDGPFKKLLKGVGYVSVWPKLCPKSDLDLRWKILNENICWKSAATKCEKCCSSSKDVKRQFFKNNGPPRALFNLFSYFQRQFQFLQQINVKMFIQYMVTGFELTTFVNMSLLP